MDCLGGLADMGFFDRFLSRADAAPLPSLLALLEARGLPAELPGLEALLPGFEAHRKVAEREAWADAVAELHGQGLPLPEPWIDAQDQVLPELVPSWLAEREGRWSRGFIDGLSQRIRLGAVVMPHNLFLHSEIIQSRQWNLENESVIRRQLKFEFFDTLLSMIVGWAINSAIIILAAATFFISKTPVTQLQQAVSILSPLLGSHAGLVFAVALLFSGLASTITSGMAGGSILAGIYKEPYDIKDSHSRLGVILSLVLAVLILFVISNPYHGLIISQMILSIQLPFTIFTQISLTSSSKVMGSHVNRKRTTVLLLAIGAIVTFLNIRLLISFL